MDQVSRPMQVALIAVVLLAGLWFVALRPKSDDGAVAPTPAAAPKAPGQQGLENAVDAAKGAVTASERSAAATRAAAEKVDGEAAKTAKPAATSTAGKSRSAAADADAALGSDLSSPLLAQLGKGKTVVMLFWNPANSVDRFAWRSVSGVDRADGRVVSRTARLSQLSRYAPITSGVTITTTPTVVVIGPDRKAVSHIGYLERKTLEQLVGDSRRKG